MRILMSWIWTVSRQKIQTLQLDTHLRVDRMNGSIKHQHIRAASHKSIISCSTWKTSEVKKQSRKKKKMKNEKGRPRLKINN
jgi:hypothetical protein